MSIIKMALFMFNPMGRRSFSLCLMWKSIDEAYDCHRLYRIVLE